MFGAASNPPVNTSSVQVTTSGKDFSYANVTNVGVGYTKLNVISKQTRYNALTGAQIGVIWHNEDTGLDLLLPPVLSELSEIPFNGQLDMGDNVVTTIDATAGGTALAALPVGTNGVTLFITQDQPDGVNLSTSATAPLTGPANGQTELQPNGTYEVVSGADLTALKLIAKSAVSVKVTASPFYRFPKFS